MYSVHYFRMELLINPKNEVFTFHDELGEKVWEPQPITRFRFKKPIENSYIRELLEANSPVAGIFFNGNYFIGTNDGMIYTKDKTIQRIPEIIVDKEIFLDEYIDVKEKYLFLKFKKDGLAALDFQDEQLVKRIFEIHESYNSSVNQRDNIDQYLRGYLSIRGFVVSQSNKEDVLFDGHLLGISDTISGELINPMPVQALYQITSNKAGFVPSRYPPVPSTRTEINKGIIKNLETQCVDHNSLWDITGQGIFVKDICPRDGSGYAPAKFATGDGLVAISHGDHPFYFLDIMEINNGHQERKSRVRLDHNKLPSRLWIVNRNVLGNYGNTIKNFSTGEDIFTPRTGEISSISDSGLCAVVDEEETIIYNPISNRANHKPVGVLKGEYKFLNRVPQ